MAAKAQRNEGTAYTDVHKGSEGEEMKSVSLEITQSEVMPNSLFWRIKSDGISTSGMLEISCENDKARFQACAVHALAVAGVFQKADETNVNGN